ncbi:MAG: hypothetical protein ACN6O3_01365 [Comamonas sp.]
MKKTMFCLAGLLLAVALGTGGTAQAARRSSSAQADRPAPAAKSPHHRAKRPRSQGSAETTTERERRLLRECRGLPNAGACLGYGS